MTNENSDHNSSFANLNEDQVAAIKTFEKEFNTKYSSRVFIMAFDNK